MTHDFNIQKGDLLVAEPFMKDPSFKRTVTLICEHNTEGTLGLVLSRPSSKIICTGTVILNSLKC